MYFFRQPGKSPELFEDNFMCNSKMAASITPNRLFPQSIGLFVLLPGFITLYELEAYTSDDRPDLLAY